MRSLRSAFAAVAAAAIVFGAAGTASADVNVTITQPAVYNIVFGDWLQIAGDDVFNAGFSNVVGSNN
ncbi:MULTISPECIES: hypothetical protein [unclassified Streptomyces]|uniref:hypothetical protein n=1 Tax=unclassified Streptomyces TaxID=2593676 RepID=UPI0015C4BE04|nr:hypothetical protein [Streptomyces sp. BR123]NXY97836.1 hypothetical protein [Streptomyces sp. BR123]